jgi:spermidine/putrescine transport system substrate-binding protein
MTLKTTLLASAAILALSTAARAEGELHLYIWSDSIAPELITKFEAETGTKVTVDGYNSNEDLLTKLQAGATGYDLVMP